MATLTAMLEAAGVIPVVVLTGLGDEQLGRDAVAAGVDDYLKDQLSAPELLARTLDYAINRRIHSGRGVAAPDVHLLRDAEAFAIDQVDEGVLTNIGDISLHK